MPCGMKPLNPCGKRPLVKNWDKSKSMRLVKPSRYQKNEASVKVHWQNVMKEMESFYHDDKFWESNSKTVRELVGPVIYERLAKIFDLPMRESPYEPQSEHTMIVTSEQFFVTAVHSVRSIKSKTKVTTKSLLSFTSEDFEEEGEYEGEEQSSVWSESTNASPGGTLSKQHTKSDLHISRTKIMGSKSVAASKLKQRESFQKSLSKMLHPSIVGEMSDSSVSTNDDIYVHAGFSVIGDRFASRPNPHFEMLYCAESESDMIKWNSHYKIKGNEESASDSYSKRTAKMIKHICDSFYEWWISQGSKDYKGEIKSPDDIENLFQIWFDEHASRGLMLDPKIIPCVGTNIAEAVKLPESACASALKRQIAWDIEAETSPAHTRAFNTSLPRQKRHIPPKNNTAAMWRPVRIPEDLKTMSAVWEDILHITSTKAYTNWLHQHPNLTVPPVLQTMAGERKQLFVVPSDVVFADDGSKPGSRLELNIPVSEHNIVIKEVISNLLRD